MTASLYGKYNTYRKLHAMDMDGFRQDLENCNLTSSQECLSNLISSYNSTQTSLLDEYAPMK